MSSPGVQSVLKDFRAFVSNPASGDVGNIIAEAQKLTPEEMEQLAKEISNIPDLTDEAKHELQIQLMKFLESKTGIELTFNAARNAAKLVISLDAKLEQLLKDVAPLDTENKTSFGNTARELLDDFRAIVRDSRSLANRIGAYGKDFHNLIKPAVNDPSLTPAQRVEIITAYQTTSEEFKADSHAISTRLDKLNSRFTQFNSELDGWGKKTEGDLGEKITKLRKEAADINTKIAELTNSANNAFNIGFGVAICAGFLVFAGPVGIAAAAIIGGIAFTAGTITALAHLPAINTQKELLKAKNKEIENAEGELAHFSGIRRRMHELATRDSAELQSVMSALTQVWGDVERDLELINTHLKTGKALSMLPPLVKRALDEANLKYLVMARYLEEYAHNMPIYK